MESFASTVRFCKPVFRLLAYVLAAVCCGNQTAAQCYHAGCCIWLMRTLAMAAGSCRLHLRSHRNETGSIQTVAQEWQSFRVLRILEQGAPYSLAVISRSMQPLSEPGRAYTLRTDSLKTLNKALVSKMCFSHPQQLLRTEPDLPSNSAAEHKKAPGQTALVTLQLHLLRRS